MITLKSDDYNNKFLSHWCMTDYGDASVKMSNASFWKKNLLFFCNFLDWRMIWCVFWKTTYRSQISIYFGVCSIIFTWKRTGITESCCSHVQGREITQIFVGLLHESKGETIFETNSKIFYSKCKIFLTLRSFSSLTDAGSTLVSEIQ